MRDRSITNWFGENIDEQEKRRQWLRGVYDNASSDNINLSDNNFQSQPKKQNPLQQIRGAVGDLVKNYYDMRKDDTIGNDDYFHCKANFDATQRGEWGEATAKYLGYAKERFDYIKNRLKNNISAPDAYTDYLDDKNVNMQGRHQQKTGLYNNSKQGCLYFRKEDTDDKY